MLVWEHAEASAAAAASFKSAYDKFFWVRLGGVHARNRQIVAGPFFGLRVDRHTTFVALCRFLGPSGAQYL